MIGWDNDINLLVAVILAMFAGAGFLLAIRPLGRLLSSDPRPIRGLKTLPENPIAFPRNTELTRSAANQPAPVRLRGFWVVDGDTIKDRATGIIYRLENIDCPETDERAKCYRERELGKRAKFEAYRLLKDAKIRTVRPTGKVDQYGRSVAAIDTDGRDFGQLMIDRGFAVPWRGIREDWCGPNGGLAKMAEASSAKLHCKTCGARANVAKPPSPPVSQPPPTE